MARLLRIDASAREERSHSRDIAAVFESRWLEANPNGEVVVRDLVKLPVAHISATTISGFYTPAEQLTTEMRQATQLSDTLIAELKAADEILISTPMYNFSIPSALKAYIDQIVRIGHTFGYDEQRGFFGLLNNKKVVVVTAAGAVGYVEGDLVGINFLQPYLKAIFSLLGLVDIRFINIEGSTLDESVLRESRSHAHLEITRLTGT